MRVLVLDFDFFSALGGGQTFYRRLVERHPEWEFHYPSRGADLQQAVRRVLPANAKPFAFDHLTVHHATVNASMPGPSDRGYINILAQIAIALQGRAFDVVELPSFFPIAHRIRPIFAAHDIIARRISLGMLGWLSVSIRNAYTGEIPEQAILNQETVERLCIAAADVPYTISDLHATENVGSGREVASLDMHDALEAFETPGLDIPGEGPPDLWYIGRLDRNKGPDIFIEMVARLSRDLYRAVYLAGPDNPWSASLKWSEEVMALAKARGVVAEYLGEISNDELRSRVFRGRSVLVIPSRSDAFNYVALEALLNGAPIVLSDQAGAAGFLQARHPEIAPPIMDPGDIPGAAAKLRALLETYPEPALRLRRALNETPWPQPRNGFLAKALAEAGDSRGVTDMDVVASLRATNALGQPAATGWRTASIAERVPDLTVVLLACDDLRQVERSLASLIGAPGLATVVIDDGGAQPVALAALVGSFDRDARIIRQGGQGRGAALSRGLKAVAGPFVTVLRAGEGLDPERVAALAAQLRAAPDMGAIAGRWQELDDSGTPVAEHGADALEQRAVSLDRQPAPGPGGVLRKTAIERVGGVNVTLGDHALTDLWVRLDDQGVVAPADTLAGWWWRDGAHPSAPTLSAEIVERQRALRRLVIERIPARV